MQETAEATAPVEELAAKTEAQPPVEAAKPPEPPVESEEVKGLRAEVAKLTKQAGDSRGREIGLLKQAERDALIQRIAEKQEALATAVETQDWAAYRAKVEEINDAARQTQLTAEQETVRQEALTELLEMEERLGGHLDKNPLFANALLFWRNGRFEKAVAEAHKAGAKLIQEKLVTMGKEHAKSLKEATAAAAKAAKEEAGAFDLTTGRGAGAGGKPSKDEVDQWYNQGKYPDSKYRHFLETGEIT